MMLDCRARLLSTPSYRKTTWEGNRFRPAMAMMDGG
jgi:hypothetical protein